MSIKHNNFDTIEMRIPSSCFQLVKDLSTDEFIITENINTQTTSYTLKKDEIGLSKFLYKECNNQMDSYALITISSKILLDDSPELIHKGNFHKVINGINKLGIIDLNTHKVIKHAQVFKIDCTSDIVVNDKECFFSYFKSQPYIKHYKSEYSSGVAFQSKSITNKARLIFYDKKEELKRATNRDFLQHLSKDTIDYFDDKIRIEFNLRKFSDITKYLGIETTSLKEILDSTYNPLLKVFERIFRESDSIIVNSDISKSKYETILGRISLLERFDNDIEKIYQHFISHGNKINKTNFFKEYLEAYDFKYSNKGQSDSLNYITMVKELLSSN